MRFFVNLQTNVYVRIRLLVVVHREGLIESSLRVIPMKASLLQVYGRRKVDIKKSSVSVGMGMCHNPSTSGRSSHALVTHISQLMLCAPCLQPQSMLKENGKFHENGLFQLRVVMNKHTLEILSATAPSHALHPRILLSVQLLWFMQQCLTEYKRGLWQLQLCLSRRDPGNISSCNSQPTSQTQSRHCQAFLGYLDLVGHGVDSCGAGILPACR